MIKHFVEKTVLLVIICLSILMQGHAEGFDFKMDDPRVEINIPGLPEITMGPHPLQAQKPFLRYMGTKDRYNLSIIVPTIDKGMTSKEFAASRTGTYISQWGLSKSQYAVYKLNENTFLLEFSTDIEGVKTVNAYLMSAYKGIYGIDVHISRIIDTEKAKSEFHNSFKGATISEY